MLVKSAAGDVFMFIELNHDWATISNKPAMNIGIR